MSFVLTSFGRITLLCRRWCMFPFLLPPRPLHPGLFLLVSARIFGRLLPLLPRSPPLLFLPRPPPSFGLSYSRSFSSSPFYVFFSMWLPVLCPSLCSPFLLCFLPSTFLPPPVSGSFPPGGFPPGWVTSGLPPPGVGSSALPLPLGAPLPLLRPLLSVPLCLAPLLLIPLPLAEVSLAVAVCLRAFPHFPSRTPFLSRPPCSSLQSSLPSPVAPSPLCSAPMKAPGKPSFADVTMYCLNEASFVVNPMCVGLRPGKKIVFVDRKSC